MKTFGPILASSGPILTTLVLFWSWEHAASIKRYPGTRQVLVGGYPGSKMCTRNSSTDPTKGWSIDPHDVGKQTPWPCKCPEGQLRSWQANYSACKKNRSKLSKNTLESIKYITYLTYSLGAYIMMSLLKIGNLPELLMSLLSWSYF